MNVLFIFPNDYLSNGIPTGIATLSAVLKAHKHNVDIFDYTFIKTSDYHQNRENNFDITLPTEYTIEDLIADDPVVVIEEELQKKIDSCNPGLMLVSVMTGHVQGVMHLLKGVDFKCNVIFGGVHPTICPKETLENDIVDFICVGEGEELIIELIDALEKGKDFSRIRNLGYKKDGVTYVNDLRPLIDLDELPTPDWGLFDLRHLFRPFMGKIYQGSFYVMSRGCPYRCSYCVNDSLRKSQSKLGKYFRYQSASTTIKQLSALKEQYGASWFKFADDSLGYFDIEYLEELAQGLKPLNIQFGCSIRPGSINEEKVKLLRKMGIVAASVGVESGNQEIRKNILNRHMTDKQIIDSIGLLKENGVRISTFNLIGLPTETRENVFETIRINKKAGVKATNVYIIYPYPCTEINIKYNINIFDRNSEIIPVSKASTFALSHMEPVEVEGLLRTFEFYVRLPEDKWEEVRRAEGSDINSTEQRTMLAKYILENDY
jgi:anaerobic magnesium-protoporphyrin IX monomethyl ester cyclase